MNKIRKYTSSDKPRLLEIIRLNTPLYFAEEEEKLFSEYLDHKIEDYFVIEQNELVVGCGGVNYNQTQGVLSWGMVHPNYHQQGFGKQLLQHRINLLKNTPSVDTITVRTSQLVFRFFEKNGFETIQYEKDFWAKGLDLYKMKYSY